MKHTSNEGREQCFGRPRYGLRTFFGYVEEKYAVWGFSPGWREQLANWSGYALANCHSRAHTGQYLFFIAFSTRLAVTK